MIGSDCPSRLNEVESELSKSDRALATMVGSDASAGCILYRSRAKLLRQAASLNLTCGSPLTMKADTWRNIDAEAGAYEHLAEKSCASSASIPAS